MNKIRQKNIRKFIITDELQEAINLKVPKALHNELTAYLLKGRHPDKFLYAMLCNKFTAFIHADEDGIEHMTQLLSLMVNDLPLSCYGNELRVNQWMMIRRDLYDTTAAFDQIKTALSWR